MKRKLKDTNPCKRRKEGIKPRRDEWSHTFEFLTRKHLFTTCAFVCKEWHALIRERFSLYLSFDSLPSWFHFIKHRNWNSKMIISLEVDRMECSSDEEFGSIREFCRGNAQSPGPKGIYQDIRLMTNLEYLHLPCIDERTFKLPDLNGLERLESLSLCDATINAELVQKIPITVRKITISPSFMSSSPVSAKKPYESISRLINLQHLHLKSIYTGAENARDLSQSTSLTCLKLSTGHVGDEGARYLSSLINLKCLRLSYDSITENGTEHLSRLTGLTSLDLSNNSINDNGAKNISALSNLTHLNLERNQITCNGANHLSVLSGLSTLMLSDNSIADEGAKYLSTLSNLTHLTLVGNFITANGAECLSRLINPDHFNLLNRSGLSNALYLTDAENSPERSTILEHE